MVVGECSESGGTNIALVVRSACQRQNVLDSGEADVPPSLPPPLTPNPSSLTQHSQSNQELQYLIHYLQVTRISDEERRRQDEQARRVELQEYCLQMEQQRQLNDECFMQLLSIQSNQELQYLIHYLQITRISDEERRRQDEQARRAELQEYCLQMEQQRQLNDECLMQLLSIQNNQELQYLIHYLQITRISDEERRRQDEQARRAELQEYCLQMEQQRQLNDERFMQLLSMIAPKPLQVQQTSPEQQAPAHQLSPVPPVATTSGSPHAPITALVMGKPMIPSPPQLQSDVTYQLFRQWRRKFEDYSVLMGLHSLPPATQHIYLRTCVSLEVQRLLHYTLAIPPDSSMPVVQVLDALQQYFRNSQNEALRRRELLSCKQTPDDSFDGREEELVQRLVSLDSQASLDDFVTCCRTFESSRAAASAIVAAPSQLNILSSYKRNQRRQKMTATTKHTPQRCQSPPLTKDSPPPQKIVPAQIVGTRVIGTVRPGAQQRTLNAPLATNRATSPSAVSPPGRPLTNQTRRARRVSTGRTPKPVNVTLSYGSKSSQLLMLPDTGADITVIGPKHLDSLGIPRCNLSPRLTDVLTADGSSMTPALGCFETTLQLGQASCKAIVHVHEDIQTPLLSYGPLRGPAIVSTDFPKPILSVTHVNRCAQQMPASAMSSPTTARTYFLQHFSDVLVSKTDLQTTPLKMSGPPMRIHLQPGATPFAIHTPRPIPFAYRDQVKEELDSLVQQGIISPVGDKPSEWCHPMVLVPKPGNGVRITVDLTRLNSQVSRPTHPSPTPADAIRTITPSAKFFTKADALHGYWQMDLAEEDRHLTTFITPHGRYYHSYGMPLLGMPTVFADLALQGITNCVKVVDDPLPHDVSSFPDYPWIKFMVAATKVSFCGYNISPEGIAADPEKVAAIRDYPTPSNITDLRSFMGLVNQLADFSPEIAATAQPLRPLMSPKRSFTWTPDHDQAFGKVKAALLSPPVLAPFNPKLPVTLQTDASRLYGLGYALFQEHGHGQLRLVQCGSRFLTDAESRYATIELEMLAASWAMGKCRLYLAGLSTLPFIPHRPLIPILNHYTLDAIENPRLQRLRVKMAPYVFTAVWRAGKTLCVPDALSRAPVSPHIRRRRSVP
nr:uncharacterized protein LOC113805212 [Penaeus vannamei]